MKIDWKKKLCSRKFWLAVVGFITPLLLAFRVSENAAAEICALIIAGADVIIYVLTEGVIDAANAIKADDTEYDKYDWE